MGFNQAIHKSFMIKLIEVEGPLDAKIWFQLRTGKFPEFIYADLCMTPPWEYTGYSTTTDGKFT